MSVTPKFGIETFTGNDSLNDIILTTCVPHLSLKPSYNWAFKYNEFGERVLVDGFKFSNLDKNTQGECTAIFMSQDFVSDGEVDAIEQDFSSAVSPILHAISILSYFEAFVSNQPSELTSEQVTEYLSNWSWIKDHNFLLFGQINVFDLVSAISAKMGEETNFNYVRPFLVGDGKQITLKLLAEKQDGRTVINLIVEGAEKLKSVKSAELAKPSFLIVGTDVVFSNVILNDVLLRSDKNIIRSASHEFADKLYGYVQCVSRLIPEIGAKTPFSPTIETTVLFSNGTKSLGGRETFQLRVTYLDISGDTIHSVLFKKDVDDKFVGSSGGAHEVSDRDVYRGGYAEIFNIAEARLEWSWLTVDAKPGPTITIIKFTF